MPVTDATPRDLYYGWERDQWAAAAIDFESDRVAWPGLGAEVRSLFLQGFACSRLAAERLTDGLIPLVDGAPTVEQQEFLTTQLADIARHVVLFDLIRTEVTVAADGDASVPDVFKSLVMEEIPAALGAVGRSVNAAQWSFTLRLVNLALGEATLHPVQLAMARLAERRGLPGCAQGLTATTRDLERHAHFARMVLGDL